MVYEKVEFSFNGNSKLEKRNNNFPLSFSEAFT